MPRFQVYLWAFLITGLPRFLLLALGVPLWIVIASCLVGGFASGFLNPILGAVIYERVPDAVMGRVTTLNNALCWSLMPFGGLLGGVLADGFGVDVALLVVGVRLPRRHHAAARDPVVPAVRQARRRQLARSRAAASEPRMRRPDRVARGTPARLANHGEPTASRLA